MTRFFPTTYRWACKSSLGVSRIHRIGTASFYERIWENQRLSYPGHNLNIFSNFGCRFRSARESGRHRENYNPSYWPSKRLELLVRSPQKGCYPEFSWWCSEFRLTALTDFSWKLVDCFYLLRFLSTAVCKKLVNRQIWFLFDSVENDRLRLHRQRSKNRGIFIRKDFGTK